LTLAKTLYTKALVVLVSTEVSFVHNDKAVPEGGNKVDISIQSLAIE
jgi:hypothetical protein